MSDVKLIFGAIMIVLFAVALVCHNIEKNFLTARVTQLEQRVLALEVNK